MSCSLPESINLGIVAHVDAGKTSLTERLLYEAGATTALGSVDAGTTRTDALDLERRRGITIRASVTSFALPSDGGSDLAVNLLDAPGHPDFIAEVERSLAVLDAAVLVLSAVEGVQPQSVVIWRALRRVGVPTLIFVNKIDRSGADVAAVVAQVRRRLTPAVVELTRPQGLGDRAATVSPVPGDDDLLLAAAADLDDRLLARWLDGDRPGADAVRRVVRREVASRRLTPVLCGSAITGAGTDDLRRAIAGLLPRADPGTPGPVAATVFAVDRDGLGRRAWLRLWNGELRVRDRVRLGSETRPQPVTEVSVASSAGLLAATARAGQIAAIRGPAARIGDTVGGVPARRAHRFAPPTLQALVEPVDPAGRGAMFTGLRDLADEDPLIDLRLDEVAGEAAVSLHGEVQKEVIAALLEERYGVRVRFGETSVVCIERVIGVGSATDRIRLAGNPYLAGLGLRISACPVGHGVEFSPGVERGNLPRAFVTAAHEGVLAALRQGPHGWAVTDCRVQMTYSDYQPRMSRPHQKFDKSLSTIAADFRNLAPVVVAAALARAGTRVCEPVDRIELDLPDEALGPVAAVLGRLGAVTLETLVDTSGYTRLTGHVASAAVPTIAAQLPDLTRGEGALETRLDHHDPVTTGLASSRRRAGPDPGDRAAWFRDVPR